jgi:hypothetical protein
VANRSPGAYDRAVVNTINTQTTIRADISAPAAASVMAAAWEEFPEQCGHCHQKSAWR